MKNSRSLILLWIQLLSFAGVLLILFTHLPVTEVDSIKAAETGTSTTVYLPLVFSPEPEPIMLGISPRSFWLPTLPDALTQEFASIDAWSGKRLSLACIYHSFDQEEVVSNMLSTIWDSGYTPFVNLATNQFSITEIVNGKMDTQIRAWAKAYAVFANGGKRMAYLLPLQEMNGNWVSYGSSNPEYFKKAYQRIVNIFAAEGVPSNSVEWIFAPNGKSYTGWPDFESYYPGHAIVDGVAFSSFNYGYHPTNPYKRWENPEDIYTDFIDRIHAVTLGKPIFLAEMGTTAYGPNGYDESLKNQWLIDAYELYTRLEGVRGILYYNDHNRFDWSFYRPDNQAVFPGYITGISNDLYKYVSPAVLRDMMVDY